MSNNFAILIFFYFLSAASTLGYGFLLKRLLVSKSINFDYGFKGLLGIFFLTLYSYISHFITAHNLVHNSILVLFGVFLFFFLFTENYKKHDFSIVCLIFIILLIAFFCFKTHDDFPYYHFPYTNYLTKSDLIIGVGNYDTPWRSPSSIFYFNSLFYLPFVKYHLYHIGALLIMAYSLSTICIKLFERYNLKKFDQLFFYKLLSLAFILIFFYRISEHGTDRSAQILSFILILEILYLFHKEENFYTFSIKLFIIGSLAISLKVFYLVYLILLIPIFHFLYKEKKNLYFDQIIKNQFFYLSFLFLFLVTTVNFLNSGCLVYPLTLSCFEDFDWSIPLHEVERMRIHYENWSKAGAGPNFKVSNANDYVAYFNWLPNWIDKYFFNKVTDYLLSLALLSLVFISIFYLNKKKISKEKKINYNLLYISLIILFMEWFYNHPTLRYGGYYIIAILIFLPLSKNLSKFNYELNYKSKIFLILFLIISIFFYRNIDRINNEYVKYNYSPIKNAYYAVDENHHLRIEKKFNNYLKFYKDCTKKRVKCSNTNKLLAYEKYGKYMFVHRKQFDVSTLENEFILLKNK